MKKEIQNNLKDLANMFLDDYGNHQAFEIKDVMNASFIFSSTLLDFVFGKHKMTQQGYEKLAETLGEAIRELIIASTDVDPRIHKDELFK